MGNCCSNDKQDQPSANHYYGDHRYGRTRVPSERYQVDPRAQQPAHSRHARRPQAPAGPRPQKKQKKKQSRVQLFLECSHHEQRGQSCGFVNDLNANRYHSIAHTDEDLGNGRDATPWFVTIDACSGFAREMLKGKIESAVRQYIGPGDMGYGGNSGKSRSKEPFSAEAFLSDLAAVGHDDILKASDPVPLPGAASRSVRARGY